jgi:hypothetical protein
MSPPDLVTIEPRLCSARFASTECATGLDYPNNPCQPFSSALEQTFFFCEGRYDFLLMKVRPRKWQEKEQKAQVFFLPG